MSHDTEFYLEKTLSENPSDIAHLLKYLYFSHIRFDGKFWYSFSNHKWNITDEDDSPLIPIIKNDLINRYLALASEYNRKIIQKNHILSHFPDENPLSMTEYLPLIISDLTNKSRLCSNLSLQLNEHTFIQKVNDSSRRLFTTKHFDNLLDQNTNLIGFSNGNYNLKTHTIDVPHYTHFVTMSTGYDYLKDSPYHDDVINFFNSLNLLNTLPHIASLLLGTKRLPLIWIKGLNENSIYAISNLLQISLGDYIGHLNFCDLRKRKIPSPLSHTHTELIDNCKKRIILIEQHPDDFPNAYTPIIDALLCSNSLDLRKPREINCKYTPHFGLIVLSRKVDTEPLDGSAVFDATDVPNIMSHDYWNIDFIKILFNFLKDNTNF
jgi:D5 N terminal like